MSTGYSFTLAGKGYDNHHCHNKPQTGNEAGVWMTSCPEEMGCEFEDFKKQLQLKVDIGPCWQKVGFTAIEAEKLQLGF